MADQEIWAYLPVARLFWNMSDEELELTKRHPVSPSFAEIARHTQEIKGSAEAEGLDEEAAILKLAIRIASVEGFTSVATTREVEDIIEVGTRIEPRSPRWRKSLVIAGIVALLLAIATGLAFADLLPMPIQDLIDRIDLPVGKEGNSQPGPVADTRIPESAPPSLGQVNSFDRSSSSSKLPAGKASPLTPSPNDRARDPASGDERARDARERRLKRRIRGRKGEERSRRQPNGSRRTTWRFLPKPRARYSNRAART